ncbi:MAG: hypothetical protein KDK39_17345, partial [Leptospiraceae bacterium]|nr:hypothetical protein [Leptospiraceae bacterium]
MSYSLMPWALDWPQFRAVCFDDDRVATCIRNRADAIRRYNEHFRVEIEGGDPDLETALKMISARQKGPGYALGYALDLLVQCHGRLLANAGLSACRWSWIAAVAAAVQQVRPELDLESDFCRQPPGIDLPTGMDFPLIGFIPRHDLHLLASVPHSNDDEL